MNRAPKKSLEFLLARTARFGGPEPNGRSWNLAELFAISNGSAVDPDAFLALVFRADASVSALWASLDPESRTVVEECHCEAVSYSLERVEWSECAYQEPLYRRFLHPQRRRTGPSHALRHRRRRVRPRARARRGGTFPSSRSRSSSRGAPPSTRASSWTSSPGASRLPRNGTPSTSKAPTTG